MDAHLKVFARVLVLEGTTNNRVAVLLGWKWDWTPYLGLGATHRFNDLLGCLIDLGVVVRLEANTIGRSGFVVEWSHADYQGQPKVGTYFTAGIARNPLS